MKVILLTASETGYIFNGVPHIDKDPIPSATSVILTGKKINDLLNNLWNVGRNITTDKFFTDFKLVDDLISNRIT